MVKVAVVGAGGLVGTRLVQVLEERKNLDIDLLLTGHLASVGKTLSYRDQRITVRKTILEDLKDCHIVVLCTPTQVSLELAETLRGSTVLVDTSSAFRMDEEVPLVIPEVNVEELSRHKGIVAGPNCSTIQLVMTLHPIRVAFGLRRVYVSTYQSVSGVGYRAMRELEELSFDRLIRGASPPERSFSEFPHPIAFNLIPEIDCFTSGGYTKEEMKMVNETRKILSMPELRIAATCVRVPVFVGHAESCVVGTLEDPEPEEVRRVLDSFPGVKVLDDPERSLYPMPVLAEGKNEVFVGRVRKDLSEERSVLYWVVADNLRRGAATNACNIVEALIERGLF